MILNLENAKLFINDDLKIGYFLISPKFYNTVQYTVVHVLKGDYLNKGYKMIILDTYIPKQDMVEHIIGKELPYLAKMIDFYTQDLYNVKYPKEFNIRKFVDSFITDHLCKTYKMCKKVLVRVISELKLGWYVTSSRVITPIQEHDFSINKTATKIKVLYISSKETNIPKLLRYILENVKNITSEKLYEGSIDGYITNYMKTLVL